MPTVTRKGQVTIPKKLREKLGIRPGDKIEFKETEDGVILSKETEENPFEEWKGSLDTGKKTDELLDELRPR